MSRSGRLLLPAVGILFLFTCTLAWEGPPLAWEIQLSAWIHSVQGTGVNWTLRAVSRIGSEAVPFLLIPLLAFVLWKAGLAGRAWILLAGAAVASLTNLTLKHLIDRPRPGGILFPAYKDLGSPGFPSGHVVLFVTCFGYLILLARKHLSGSLRTIVTGGLAFLILSVGISRVWLGVHWPLDCVGGYLLGTLVLTVMWRRG